MGLALLATVTLDGVPENLALGFSLADEASVTLLVAISPPTSPSRWWAPWPCDGAVIASLADTLMPEAFEHGQPLNAHATALGASS